MSFDSRFSGLSSPVENIAEDLKFTSIETLKLGQSQIPFKTFPLYVLNKELFTTNITEIYITDNAGKAGYFPPYIGYPPPTLQILDLSNNGLIRFHLDIKNITRLILKQNLLGSFLSTNPYFTQITRNDS
ncbi:Hypothetical predicted protein, partial [Mytilus galloprovincialis]